MPQELALYTEFTILETFYYFGRINKMSSSQVYLDIYLVIYNIYSVPAQIRSQTEFLAKLLDLPPDSRTVATLSGGQQRRVSLAVSGVMEIMSTYNI